MKAPLLVSRSWSERLALSLLLALAFALSGWKVFTRPPAPDFAAPAVNPPLPDLALVKPHQAGSGSVPLEQSSPDGRLRFQAAFVSGIPGRAVHAASAVELKSGDLRAVWFSGSREGSGDVTIQSAMMNPLSLQWTAETTLFGRREIQRDLWRYVKKIGNPVIARGPDGALYLWMVNVSLGGWAGSSISWSRSTDEGASWSAPRRLVTSPFLNISTLVKGAPFFYANGQIGLPVYHEFVTKLGEVLRLDVDGRVLDKVRIRASQTSLQPVVLVSGTRRAEAYMRSGNAKGLMVSSTDDAGQTWLPTRPGALTNPDSALAGVAGADGRQWLALNPTTNHRETLALVAASSAFAHASKTVSRPFVIEASATPGMRLGVAQYEALLNAQLRASGASPAQAQTYVASARRQLCGPVECAQEFSYPFLLQGRDGHLHLFYTWHRTRIKHIRLDSRQEIMASHAAAAH